MADRLFATLQAGIVDGTYRAGTLLPSERELARIHTMNRQPVREALQRLRQQGLVDIVQGEGARVRDWQADAHLSVLLDAVVTPEGEVNTALGVPLLRLRAVTMIEAARMAATNRTDDDLVAMRAALDETRPLGDRRNLDFWGALADASDCMACRLIHNSIEQLAARLPLEVRQLVAGSVPLAAEAGRLIGAVEARDPEVAGKEAAAILVPAVERMEGRW